MDLQSDFYSHLVIFLCVEIVVALLWLWRLIYESLNNVGFNGPKNQDYFQSRSRTQMQELVHSVRELSTEVVGLNASKKEGRGKVSSREQQKQHQSMPHLLQALPISDRGHSHQIESSSVVTTGSRVSSNDPAFENRSLQGIKIQGEKSLNMPIQGSRPSA